MEIQDKYIKRLLEKIDDFEDATDSFFADSLSEEEAGYYSKAKSLIGYIQALRELDERLK